MFLRRQKTTERGGQSENTSKIFAPKNKISTLVLWTDLLVEWLDRDSVRSTRDSRPYTNQNGHLATVWRVEEEGGRWRPWRKRRRWRRRQPSRLASEARHMKRLSFGGMGRRDREVYGEGGDGRPYLDMRGRGGCLVDERGLGTFMIPSLFMEVCLHFAYYRHGYNLKGQVENLYFDMSICFLGQF